MLSHNFDIETFLIGLIDLIDQTKVDGIALKGYTIVPKDAQYPYVRISEVMRMEEQPCTPTEYLSNCVIVTQGKSYQPAFDIFYEVEKAIKNFLKNYFDTQVLIRFMRVRTMQVREDLQSVMFTLSLSR